MLMLDKFLEKKKNVYFKSMYKSDYITIDILCHNNLGQLKIEMFSIGYILYFVNAVIIMGIYAVMWQLILEHLPLTTAYLRKGITYIISYLWAYLFFHEKISMMQWIGTAIILAGMFVSQLDYGKKDEK